MPRLARALRMMAPISASSGERTDAPARPLPAPPAGASGAPARGISRSILVGLHVIAPACPHLGLERRPIEAGVTADIGEGFVDAALHPLEAADVDVGGGLPEERSDGGLLGAQPILHVGLGLAGDARVAQVLRQEALRHLLQRAEIGQLRRSPAASRGGGAR